MDKKAKNVSISQIDKVMKETYKDIVLVEWCDIDLEVKKSLAFDDMLQFVHDVVKTCTEQEHGGYMPELKEFAIRMNIVETYSNVRLPSNLNHKYHILTNSGIVETILNHINTEQFNCMREAIDSKLEAVVATNVNAVQKQLSDITVAFEQMQRNMENAMSGLDMSVLERFVESASDDNVVNNAVLSYVKGKET